MAYTKQRGTAAKITIDGTDVSNSFREFRYASSQTKDDATGFNATNTTESVPGPSEQFFEGTAWYTEELAAIIEPIHRAGTATIVTFQPNGLVDATREIYSGSMYITSFEAPAEVGTVMQTPFRADPATSAGITVSDWT